MNKDQIVIAGVCVLALAAWAAIGAVMKRWQAISEWIAEGNPNPKAKDVEVKMPGDVSVAASVSTGLSVDSEMPALVRQWWQHLTLAGGSREFTGQCIEDGLTLREALERKNVPPSRKAPK